jgi:hypothetical protein
LPHRDDPPFTAYPAAPWRFRGQLWCTVLPTIHPQPSPLPPLLGAHRLVVLLIRYRQGPLVYDEFAFGSLVRRGRHAGLWVQSIWVDSAASLWGGRRIWGLPKQLAHFEWGDGEVRIGDATGELAVVRFAPRTRRGPALSLRARGFGQSDAALLLSTIRVRGPIRPASIAMTAWADRLPELSHTASPLGLTVDPARLTIGSPGLLPPLPGPVSGRPGERRPEPPATRKEESS